MTVPEVAGIFKKIKFILYFYHNINKDQGTVIE